MLQTVIIQIFLFILLLQISISSLSKVPIHNSESELETNFKSEPSVINKILTNVVPIDSRSTVITKINLNSKKRNNTPLQNIQLCKDNHCILKCCGESEYVAPRKKCTKTNQYHDLDLSRVPLYDINRYKTNKNLRDEYIFAAGVFGGSIYRRKFKDNKFLHNHNHYLTDNGFLIVEVPNKWNIHILNNEEFCVDYMIKDDHITEPEVTFWTVYKPDNDDNRTNGNDDEIRKSLITSGFIISSVFLAVVLLVYALLPELRNLSGLVLMAYIFSLLGAFLLLAIMRLKVDGNLACLVLTLFIYFFWMASFCWTNIMSVDIWWTFRGYAKARLIHRRGVYFKFGVYCAYAWGLPLAMTIGLAVLEYTDLTPIPWFLAPNLKESKHCFIAGMPKVFYLYLPMMILSLSNWAFFLMTVYNMRRLHRSTAVLDSAAAGNSVAHRKQRNRLMVYLRLSVIMGINWALEVVSYRYPSNIISYISDTYNVLIGLSIFLIFVCKRQILAKLVKRYYGCVQSRRFHYKNRFSDTSESDVISDAPLQVCTDPMGPSGKS